MYDYDAKTMIEKVPTFAKCNRYTLPEKFEVEEVIDSICDPADNITHFDG